MRNLLTFVCTCTNVPHHEILKCSQENSQQQSEYLKMFLQEQEVETSSSDSISRLFDIFYFSVQKLTKCQESKFFMKKLFMKVVYSQSFFMLFYNISLHVSSLHFVQNLNSRNQTKVIKAIYFFYLVFMHFLRICAFVSSDPIFVTPWFSKFFVCIIIF